MKFLKFLLLFLFFISNKAYADIVALNNLLIEVTPTVSVDIQGNYSTNINPDNGTLGSNLTINFLVSSNEDLNNIRLKAIVNDSNNTSISAISSQQSSIGSNASCYVVLANNTYPPTAASIADCKAPNSTPQINEEAIAYLGTLNIDNQGTLEYQLDESNQGYYNCTILNGNTNISLNIGTTPKPGTYDSQTALDGDNTFEVMVYLDNIP